MDEIESALALTVCLDFLQRRGIELRVLRQPSDLQSLIDGSAKPYLTPLVSPEHNDLTSQNSIWLVGIKDDELVMAGGARFELVRKDEVAAYWRAVFRRAYGSEITAISERISRLVAGRVVYFGDMFVDTKSGAGILGARAFTAAGHLITYSRWSQDWTYAFLHERDAFRGAGLRYGFNWFLPRPFEWSGKIPATRSDTECCALLSSEDSPQMIRSTVGALQRIKEQ